MPERPLKPCRQSGCLALTRELYCEKHKSDNDAKDDETDALYRLTVWRGKYGFRKSIIQQNAQCQRLVDGKQCHNLSTTVHHLISPRTRPDLFLVASNNVAVCTPHHPINTDTPEWVEGVDFVKTKYEITIV